MTLTCRRLKAKAPRLPTSSRRPAPARCFASALPVSVRKDDRGTAHRFNYNQNPFDDAPDPDHHTYRRVTARELVNHAKPPKRVKMLARDFIDDCLYNPNYGYFSTQASIFDPDKAERTSADARPDDTTPTIQRAAGFKFGEMRNSRAFEEEIALRYGMFEGAETGLNIGLGRQVWHTPTELFKPWYGRAIARYLVSEYKLNLYPYEDLIIYEIGAGNGTLMGDILDYIAVEEPEVYERTRYRIIEISERLQEMQRERASHRASSWSQVPGKKSQRNHATKVDVLGGSIFDFDRVVPEPCFFLALEVLDNFAHDIVRYSTLEHEPYQCVVSVDSSGDYTEIYEPVQDPLIKRYLDLRSRLSNFAQRRSEILNPILSASALLRKIYSIIPFAPNLSPPEFLPTKQLMLLDVLRDKFPAHRILFSDFATLPDAISGANAPVVQTRYGGETVACTTYLVQPGFFDIFFPTNFRLLRDLYAIVMSASASSPATQALPIASSSSPRVGSDFFSPHDRRSLFHPVGTPVRRSLSILEHGKFLERWGEVDQTRLKDGTNPMVAGYYQNAQFIL